MPGTLQETDAELLQRVLRCGRCGEALAHGDDGLRCRGCGHGRSLSSDSILTDPDLGGRFDPDDSNYESQTKYRYQSEGYAHRYLTEYTKGVGRGGRWYAAAIAKRERSSVAKALRAAGELSTVLDLPAGTGKLASVHAEFDYDVIAGDVSAEMLRAGRDTEWTSTSGLKAMVQADVTATHFRDNSVDCVVCLRLMHRLPLNVLEAALYELKRISSRWLVLSNGVDRRSFARLLGKKPPPGRAGFDLPEWRRILGSEVGEIEAEFRVWPGISEGVVTLVRVG